MYWLESKHVFHQKSKATPSTSHGKKNECRSGIKKLIGYGLHDQIALFFSSVRKCAPRAKLARL